jgi:error-prone DNA polymerase
MTGKTLRTDEMSAPPSPSHRTDGAGSFVDLEVTSNFTFLTGASHPHELVERAAGLGAPAVAITDRATLAGVVRAHQAAQRMGIHLVVGARLGVWLDLACAIDEPTLPEPRLHPHAPAPPGFLEVLVHVPDLPAYARLSRLITLGRRRASKGRCLLSLHDLLAHAGPGPADTSPGRSPEDAASDDGLMLTLVPPPVLDEAFLEAARGIAASAGLREGAADRLSIAVRRIGDPDESIRVEQLATLSEHLGVPLVATNDVHWHDDRRRPLQDVLTAIRHRTTLDRAGLDLLGGGDRRLQSDASMRARFRTLPAAAREAVDRAGSIAARCRGFRLDQLRYEYPHEVVPEGRSPDEHLRRLVEQGARERYPPGIHPDGVPIRVRERIEHELALVRELDYARYFLTVHDIVRFARDRGILCQGRGAAANSVICFCLGVTAVDPDRIETLFERFVSRERDEPPDIDVDFEHQRREEVIQYLYRRYGRERAALAAEVICYRGRSAVREVGKVLGFAPETLDRLASGLDRWEAGGGDPERIREAGFDPATPALRRVLALANELVGFPRHLSQHVGGFVISERPLCEIVPIENAAMADRTVIEWDKDDLDAMGMLKVDILALGMLSAIRRTIELVNDSAGTDGRDGDSPPLRYHTIPAEDPAVYDMLCTGDSVGVFQVESRAQMNMLPRLRPRCFYDLVIEVAIVRPGPIQGDMVHPYLRRRRGEESLEYPDQEIRRVLERTLGVPLFQEQAMALAVVAAGFSPGEADRLRRALAAWKRPGNSIDEFRRRLIEGMRSRGYDHAFAEQVFERIRGFSGYGFPESHAASFALLVYVSAWLKRRHPAAFTAALLDSQPMGFYAPAQLVRDARDHGVRVRRVDVARSGWSSRLEHDRSIADPWMREGASADARGGAVGMAEIDAATAERSHSHPIGGAASTSLRVDRPALRLGMQMVRGLSEEDALAIVDTVERHGPPVSIESLWSQSGVGAAALRRLAAAEAFGSLGLDRSRSLWEVRALPKRRAASLWTALDKAEPPVRPHTSNVRLPKVPRLRRVALDYGTTGLSLRDHPMACMRPLLEPRGILAAAALGDDAVAADGEIVAVAGLVLCRQRPSTAKGTVFMTLEDETGIANLIVRGKVWARHRRIGRHATALCARGRLQRREGVVQLLVRSLEDLGADLARLDRGEGASRSLAGRSRDFR